MGFTCEILIFATCFVGLRNGNLNPVIRILMVLSVLGFATEAFNFLSLRAIHLLPLNINNYTYPLLTLTEFWCVVWLASYFTKEKKQLLIAGGVFTVLWIAAKLSIEPLHLFDSTTFALLSLSTLVFVGRSAQNLATEGFKRPVVRGLYWIFAGFAAYALLSPTITTVTNILEQSLRAKMWWMNNAAFALKAACICRGVFLIGQDETNALPTLQDAETKDFGLLSGAMLVLFAVKYFLFPATTEVAEFSSMVVFTALPVCGLYVSKIFLAMYELVIKERVKSEQEIQEIEKREAIKREKLEMLRRAENMNSEESAEQITDSIAIIATIVAEKLPEETNNKVQAQITRIIDACLNLLHRERLNQK